MSGMLGEEMWCVLVEEPREGVAKSLANEDEVSKHALLLRELSLAAGKPVLGE
jgi:hypothetical protein